MLVKHLLHVSHTHGAQTADTLLAPDWKGNVLPQRDYKILIESKTSSDAKHISSSVLDAEYAE